MPTGLGAGQCIHRTLGRLRGRGWAGRGRCGRVPWISGRGQSVQRAWVIARTGRERRKPKGKCRSSGNYCSARRSYSRRRTKMHGLGRKRRCAGLAGPDTPTYRTGWQWHRADTAEQTNQCSSIAPYRRWGRAHPVARACSWGMGLRIARWWPLSPRRIRAPAHKESMFHRASSVRRVVRRCRVRR